MKITLAYIPKEEKEASAVLRMIQIQHPTAKLRESDRHPPFRHAYLTIKSPESPGNTRIPLDMPPSV